MNNIFVYVYCFCCGCSGVRTLYEPCVLCWGFYLSFFARFSFYWWYDDDVDGLEIVFLEVRVGSVLKEVGGLNVISGSSRAQPIRGYLFFFYYDFSTEWVRGRRYSFNRFATGDDWLTKWVESNEGVCVCVCVRWNMRHSRQLYACCIL